MKQFLYLILLGYLTLFSLQAQEGERFVVVSYNVENLFDTDDNPETEDEEFLPMGARHWTKGRYYQKLQHIAQALIVAGEWDTPSLIGLCEVEGDSAVHALLHRTSLRSVGYRYCITHGNDKRGINVALLYDRTQFHKLGEEELIVPLPRGERSTRNILHVWGEVRSLDTLDVFVCHLPSRYGGELASRPKRHAAARLLRSCIDSIYQEREKPLCLVMGDFNDTAEDETLTSVLGAQPFPSDSIHDLSLYNLFTSAQGSHKYQGMWHQLDHILVNGRLARQLLSGSAEVLRHPFLLTRDKTWRGVRPFRSYYGFRYEGGYSDHLPLRIVLLFP